MQIDHTEIHNTAAELMLRRFKASDDQFMQDLKNALHRIAVQHWKAAMKRNDERGSE